MKALSVRNPWANDIMCGLKPYEFRSWKTEYRGDLVICSSANPKVPNTIMGHALCIVRLNDVFEVTEKNYRKFGLYKSDLSDGKLYAWELTNVRVIKPVPVKGKLNFFDVDDSLLEVIDNGEDELSEEEVDELFNKYINPLIYRVKE